MARKYKKHQVELNATELQSLVRFVEENKDLYFEKFVLRWEQGSGIGTGISIKLSIDDPKNVTEVIDVTDWKDISDYSSW